MTAKDPPNPTEAELEILHVLWERGPSTVREVFEEIQRVRPSVYTTVLKLMQIMTEKGLVRRDETERAHVYKATRTRERTQRRLLGDLLDRAFNGSASQLVMQALSARRASSAEIAEIREMLDELEGRKR